MLTDEFKDHDGELGFHRNQAMSTLKTVFDFASQQELTRDDMNKWRLSAAIHMYHYAHCGFPVYPKFHYFMHMPEQVERGGVPRNFWVYSDESKNGEVKKIWDACSKGWSLAQQVILRLEWLWGLQALASN